MLGPIFAREFLTVPRSKRHYWARTIALGAFLTLGLTAWLASSGLGSSMTLGETARFGRLLFQMFVFVGLVLVIFFAALSAAGTVSREKDRRTFILLLLTDLRDHEIVVGKMLGSLLPIGLLLLGFLPILMMLVLLGGLQPAQVVSSWLVLCASAFVAGSFGALMALWRDRTYQSLAFAVLGVVLYFCVTRTIALVGPLIAQGVNWNFVSAVIDPVITLLTVVDPFRTAASTSAPLWYVAFAGSLGIVLNLIGIWMLRVWNPGREPIMQRESNDEAIDSTSRAAAHAAPGRVRRVWSNPILWREIQTRAYGRKPYLIKLLYFIVLALICYGAFAGFSERVPFQAAYGLLPVAILSLFLAVAQSVTAITSERDTGALDLLLVTDLTPQEFIFGKLLGVAYNVKEFLIPPLVLACVYAYQGILATPPSANPELAPRYNIEALVAVLGSVLMLVLFVLILGMFIALRTGNSRQAIFQGLGTVFFLSIGTLICIFLIVINGGTFEYQFLSFSLFLIAGIGGLWWVLSADRPSPALTIASISLPLLVFYTVTNILVARPGSVESTPPLVPFLVVVAAFGFAIMAMMVPLLSEFDVALGRTRIDE